MNRHQLLVPGIVLLVVLAVLLVVLSVSADSSGWSWQAGSCGIPPQVGGVLYDQTITIQPDSEVCVVPPSYQMTFGPRYYVGIWINDVWFIGSSYADPRCTTITGNTATIHSETYCTAEALRWPGTITYTPPDVPTCFCNSCDDCNTKLGSSCTTVYLTADINDHYGKCIEFPASNKVFDCQGHSIDGDDVPTSPDYGIHMNVKSGNTVRNCVITDFATGIYMEAPYPSTFNNNQLVDNIVSSNGLGISVWGNSDNPSSSNTVARNVVENNNDGIILLYTKSNTVDDNEVKSNGRGLVFGGYTTNNVITDNIMQLNETGIAFYANTLNNTSVYSNTSCSSLSIDVYNAGTNNQGDHNTCDLTSGWDDTSAALGGCEYACPATDTDSDGVLDSFDNCITEFNPDQFDTDGDFAGDVCDDCPSDPGDTCDVSGSAGESIGSDGGILTSTNGEVQIAIPSGSLSEETSISMTKDDDGTPGLATSFGTGESLYAYNLLPTGQSFNPAATVMFSWLDENSDGLEDTTGINELLFQLFRYEDPLYEPITDLCEIDPRCDTLGNTITVDLDSFSYYALIRVEYNNIYLPIVLGGYTP